MFCKECASYQLRQRALHGNMQNYTCCNGAFPCSGKMGEQNAPELCLCLEACCCFPTSVQVTRYMVQDEMHVENTQCDNCLIGTMVFFQYLACACRIAACLTQNEELEDLSDLVDLIADLLFCTVCACMQTQAKVQMDERDANPALAVGGGPRPPMQRRKATLCRRSSTCSLRDTADTRSRGTRSSSLDTDIRRRSNSLDTDIRRRSSSLDTATLHHRKDTPCRGDSRQ